MKYISIDVETTGLNKETCQLLSIGAVIEDTNNILPLEDLPQIHIVLLNDLIQGELKAINMHRDLIENIVKYKSLKTNEEIRLFEKETKTKYSYENSIVQTFIRFLSENNYYEKLENNSKYIINAAGKNFSFDRFFLEKIPNWKNNFIIRQRVLDPAILFTDWNKDEVLPSLSLCKERANICGKVTHNSLDDAMDVVKLLRKIYSK